MAKLQVTVWLDKNQLHHAKNAHDRIIRMYSGVGRKDAFADG